MIYRLRFLSFYIILSRVEIISSIIKKGAPLVSEWPHITRNGKTVSKGFYYVDKTGMIAELLSGWSEVNLFTRPRRFGKSLNMSMLK